MPGKQWDRGEALLLINVVALRTIIAKAAAWKYEGVVAPCSGSSALYVYGRLVRSRIISLNTPSPMRIML